MTAAAWVEEGTAAFLATVRGLDADQWEAPSLLDGWDRRHLVAHVHFNALALRRLVSWARTGEETPMYADAAQRTSEIERGSRLPPSELTSLVASSAADLYSDLASCSPDELARVVRTAQGREVPLSEVWWMRGREVMVHAVDLDVGIGFSDLPSDFNRALVEDIIVKRIGMGEVAALAEILSGRGSSLAGLGAWL